MNILEKFGNIPINNSVLSVVLNDYKFPRNKIATMEKRGDIIRLKNGLFVVSDAISRQKISRELIANHLYGPSYVSMEYALSQYGLIPEKVHIIRSVVAKRAKRFSNVFGNFEYVSVPDNYYKIGIHQQIIDNQYAYLIATPEKAVCDVIVTTSNLRLQSVKQVQTYLEDDLRFDISAIDKWNVEIIRQCVDAGIKRTELQQLLKLCNR